MAGAYIWFWSVPYSSHLVADDIWGYCFEGEAGCNGAIGLVEAFRTMTLLQCLQQFLGRGCLVLCENRKCCHADSMLTHC